MDETTLRQLIAGGETGTVEFKVKAPRPTELAERMCGMVNTRTGGVIIFGVRDEDVQIVGVEKPGESIDSILRAARLIHPVLPLVRDDPHEVLLDGQRLLVVTIAPNDGTLYQASGVFWYRRGSHTVPLSIEEISTHLYHTGALQWETELCRLAKMDDLDDARIQQYLSFRTAQSRQNLRHISQEELLTGLHCCAIDPQTGTLHPTNVGMLMFGIDPQWHVPQSEIVCVHYADDLGVKNILIAKFCTGPRLS